MYMNFNIILVDDGRCRLELLGLHEFQFVPYYDFHVCKMNHMNLNDGIEMDRTRSQSFMGDCMKYCF